MTGTANFYFAYGSNMDAKQIKHRGLAVTDRFRGVLRGHRLVFNKRAKNQPGVAHANVEPCADALVEGALYTLAHAGAIEAMDSFEGYPQRYQRKILAIETDRGVHEAWVYVANPVVIEAGLAPTAEYLSRLLAGKDLLSRAYFDCLKEVEVAPVSGALPHEG